MMTTPPIQQALARDCWFLWFREAVLSECHVFYKFAVISRFLSLSLDYVQLKIHHGWFGWVLNALELAIFDITSHRVRSYDLSCLWMLTTFCLCRLPDCFPVLCWFYLILPITGGIFLLLIRIEFLRLNSCTAVYFPHKDPYWSRFYELVTSRCVCGLSSCPKPDLSQSRILCLF